MAHLLATICPLFVNNVASSLLCSWLLGLLSILGSMLLSSLLRSWLLDLRLHCLLLLGLLSLDNLVGSSSLTGCSGYLTGSLCTLEGQADLDSSLGSINRVVFTDVLEDSLAGGACAVLKGGDGITIIFSNNSKDRLWRFP